MNKPTLAITVALAVAIAGGGGYWFGAHRSPATNAPAQAASAPPATAAAPPLVEAAKVRLQALPQTITTVGSLRSDESITVRPEVAGRIQDILFKEGQRVAKGSTLIRLDPAINAAEVQQARANLKLAQSKYQRAVRSAIRHELAEGREPDRLIALCRKQPRDLAERLRSTSRLAFLQRPRGEKNERTHALQRLAALVNTGSCDLWRSQFV